MRDFDIQNPARIVFGKDTVRRIGEDIQRDRHKLVLLIADGGSIKMSGVYRTVRESLVQATSRRAVSTCAETLAILTVMVRANLEGGYGLFSAPMLR